MGAVAAEQAPVAPQAPAAAQPTSAQEADTAAQLPALLAALGVQAKLDLPAEALWREVGQHHLSVAEHLIKLGAYLVRLRTLTPKGQWVQALQTNGISRQRASEATRVIGWLSDAHVRSSGHRRKITHLAARKLLAISRIPLSTLEENGFDLPSIAETNFAKLTLEISRLKKRLQAAESGSLLTRKVEREYRAALRRLVENYREAAALGVQLLGLSGSAHGNARRALVQRITATHDAAMEELRVITAAEISPALVEAQGGSAQQGVGPGRKVKR